MFGATSGKVYPWALPPWVDRVDVGHFILRHLVDALRDRLVNMVPPATKHGDSGSDSGRSDDDEEGPKPKKRMNPPAHWYRLEDEDSE